MPDRETIVAEVLKSACLRSEVACIAAGGIEIGRSPRLFKYLENDKVRIVFPARITRIEEGVVVALVCLYDLGERNSVYAHAVFAGPSVNASLRSLFVPTTQANPQPGVAGLKAILKFVAWKQAGWTKFCNDELELGNERASVMWLACFWKALDRMYGGGNLLDETS
jgi:hypothetical protein